MVLHLGDEKIASIENIIAILDINSIKDQNDIDALQGSIIKISDERIKSCVLVKGINGNLYYLSPISTTTLLKRYYDIIM